MTGPRLSKDRYGRRYVWPPTGAEVPSVTTIMNNAAKPALKHWAAKMVAEYAVEHQDSWTGLPPEDAIDLLKKEPLRYTQRRADVGSAVHAALEAWRADIEPLVEVDLIPYVAGGIMWLDDHVHHIIHREATIFNLTYQYAGTCDLIVQLNDGRTAIADWKTSKDLYPEVAWQLAAYAHGEFIAHTTDNGKTWLEIPLPTIDTAIAVNIPGTGGYTAKETPITPRRFKEFIALRTLQHFKDHEDVWGQTWQKEGQQ